MDMTGGGDMTKKKNAILIYLLIFYSLWTLFEMWGKAQIDFLVPSITAGAWIKSGIIKNLVWTMPAILLVRHFGDDVHIPLKQMFTSKVNILRWLPLFAVTAIILLAEKMIETGSVSISEGFGADKLIICLFVGITEEMVFRGWLLNSMYDEKKPVLSIFINSLLFLAIHFPRWIYSGELVSIFTGFGFLTVMGLGALFCYMFLKTRNILLPTAFHMYYDLLCFMLF